MKEQFTKAPWKYSHEPDTRMSSADQHEHKILATNDDCEFRVASVNVFDSEDIANAHLIAAAPKMYEFLKRVHTLKDCDMDYAVSWIMDNANDIGDLLDEARGETT